MLKNASSTGMVPAITVMPAIVTCPKNPTLVPRVRSGPPPIPPPQEKIERKNGGGAADRGQEGRGGEGGGSGGEGKGQ